MQFGQRSAIRIRCVWTQDTELIDRICCLFRVSFLQTPKIECRLSMRSIFRQILALFLLSIDLINLNSKFNVWRSDQRWLRMPAALHATHVLKAAVTSLKFREFITAVNIGALFQVLSRVIGTLRQVRHLWILRHLAQVGSCAMKGWKFRPCPFCCSYPLARECFQLAHVTFMTLFWRPREFVYAFSRFYSRLDGFHVFGGHGWECIFFVFAVEFFQGFFSLDLRQKCDWMSFKGQVSVSSCRTNRCVLIALTFSLRW